MRFFIPALPLVIGFMLDAAIGDPYSFPHPVRLIGRLISALEGFVRKRFRSLRRGGVFLAVTVCTVSAAVPAAVLFCCYRLNIILGIAAESVLCCYLTAARCLCSESMKVYRAVRENDTEKARKAVSMIVGRDTDVLDRDGIIRAAVETVAENTSDGVTAPLFYMGIGGAVLGALYKAVNTMDSMIGYRNEKYAELGRAAAKMDDVLNYIPSRITAVLMAASAALSGLDGRNALRIWKRDRRKHASPNSAQTEAACAGALHVRLAGDAQYFGELHRKPYIGDDDREIEAADIPRANRLMYGSSVFMLIAAAVLRCIIYGGLV